jgi:dihydrofolate reductase
MGRVTWESLSLSLNERTNIVVTRQKNYLASASIIITNSLQESFAYCERESFEKCFIIGGGEIYSRAIHFANEIILSVMKFDSVGDVFFPEIDFSDWEEIRKEDFEEFTIHTYIRIEKMNEKVIVA